MHKHEYIVERLDRRTYIKGVFRGKFVGQSDPSKSQSRYERYFDLEITDGDIFTTLDNLKKWPQGGEFAEFEKVSVFPTTLPAQIRVTLQYLDGSIKHFKVKLREIKLLNCRLFNQMHKGTEVYGELEGYISGYLLHNDTVINEIAEELAPEGFIPHEIKNYEPDNNIKITGENKKSDNSIRTEPIPEKQKSGCLPIFAPLFGFFLLAVLLIVFRHWFVIVLFLVFAMALIAPFYRWLKGIFSFKHGKHLAVAFVVIFYLLIGLIVASLYQNKLNKDKASGIIAEKRKQQELNKQQKDIQYRDSFNHYYNTAKKLLGQKKKKDALEVFAKASVYAGEDEKNALNNETTQIYHSLAEELYKNGEYSQAIEVYSTLVRNNPEQTNNFYQRARCYIELGKVREAVSDLKEAIDRGDKSAQLLHEKINPLKRRVAYYVTRCCDGTTSDAKGRGACSHHGGVCDWNEPVYEEYREYQ